MRGGLMPNSLCYWMPAATSKRPVLSYRIRKWLKGNPARHHLETITKSYTRVSNRLL